ncbi:MAG: carbohydrate kinase family protein [Calditrichaeota bacterium]|nr:MAG: carbohydrate kinase family protein [Calditrichota bacterium]
MFTITPVALVGEDFWHELKRVLAPLPGLNLEHISIFPGRNTQVTLQYKTATRREETTTEPMPPLRIEHLQGLAKADGALVNMITGEDVEREAFIWLAEQTSARVYFDVHTLALGRDREGRRYYRVPHRWQDWISRCDIVQLNREEAAVLAQQPQDCEQDALQDFLSSLLALGPSGVLLTLGREGVLAACKDAAENVTLRQLRPRMLPERPVDVIGCGDTFGAAFFAHFLTRQDFFAAAQYATTIATLKTQFTGSLTREQFEKHISNYADFTT